MFLCCKYVSRIFCELSVTGLVVWEMCVSSLHYASFSINQQLLHIHETLSTPSFVLLLLATNTHLGSVGGVVPLLFTLLPLAVTQNFSLHEVTNSIYDQTVKRSVKFPCYTKKLSSIFSTKEFYWYINLVIQWKSSRHKNGVIHVIIGISFGILISKFTRLVWHLWKADKKKKINGLNFIKHKEKISLYFSKKVKNHNSWLLQLSHVTLFFQHPMVKIQLCFSNTQLA